MVVVFGDEAHLFKTKSLTNIMEKLTDCPYRFGFTGTLDGTQTHRLVLEGLFETEKVITTKELIDSDTLAKLNVVCLLLKHKEEEAKSIKDSNYAEEIQYLISNTRRNKFLFNLCKTLKEIHYYYIKWLKNMEWYYIICVKN